MCAMSNPLPRSPIEQFNAVAKKAMSLYTLTVGSTIRLLNYSENATYLIENAKKGERSILRVSRPGYHTRKELEAELIWMKSIRENTSIIVPEPIAGNNGEYFQVCVGDDQITPYYCVMFTYLPGLTPDESDEPGLIEQFKILGEITAHLHMHTLSNRESQGLFRETWDFETMLGVRPKWGRWQDGFEITSDRLALFTQTAETIERRLKQYGKTSDKFGLIHADLRLANLIVEGTRIKVIDFDDCGYGWFLYDLATALSFIEDKEYVPQLIESWLKGYEMIRPLTAEDKNEIPTFIMLRRLLLLAWIGSHSDNDTAQAMGANFTYKTVELTKEYLHTFS